MVFKKLAHYLDPRNIFKKGDGPFNLRVMHGINRISILMFLFCLGILVYKWLS